jgi:hypothetical protein
MKIPSITTLKVATIPAFVAFVMLGLTAINAFALERWFNVVNNSGSTIVAVRATNIDDNNWSRNLLDGDIIRPGRTLQVEPLRSGGYCRFDIKIEYANGDYQTIWDVNLCEATRVVTWGRVGNRFRHQVVY